MDKARIKRELQQCATVYLKEDGYRVVRYHPRDKYYVYIEQKIDYNWRPGLTSGPQDSLEEAIDTFLSQF